MYTSKYRKSTKEVASHSPLDISIQGRQGLLFMIASRLSGMLIALLSNAIMGRLLTPEDYGLVAMATTMVVLLNLLKDFGLTTAVIQTKLLTTDQLDAVFWINLYVAAGFATIGALAAPWVAMFFGYAAITNIVFAMCGSLMIVSISATHGAMLRRHLHFAPLMWSEVVGQLIGLVVGISIAWFYRSYWAIVASQISAAMASTIFLFSSLRWIPGRPRALSSAWQLIRFGANLSVFSLLNFFSNQLGAIVTGAWLGAGAAGHFNRAQQLLTLTGNGLMQPIGQTALPMLSRYQNSPTDYRLYYLSLLQRTSLFFGALGAFVIIAGDAVTMILLGPKWALAGEMYRWFGLSIIAVGMASQTGNVLISQNRTTELRHWGFGDAFIRAGASGFGVLLGAVGVAAAFGVATLFITVPIVGWIVSRKGPIQLRDQFSAMQPGALVALLSVIIGLSLRMIYWPAQPVLAAALGFFVVMGAISAMFLVDANTRLVIKNSFLELQKLVYRRREEEI